MTGYSLHWHEFIEGIYVLDGQVSVTMEGQDYHVKKGDVVIINSGSIHGYSRMNCEPSLFIFQFGLELFNQTKINLRNRVFQKLIYGRDDFSGNSKEEEIYKQLEMIIYTLNREYTAREEGYQLAIKARLYDLALFLLRQVPARKVSEKEIVKRKKRNETMEKIFALVHQQYQDDITLDMAADTAHLSKFYFSRFFKEQTGQTFHSYLSRIRIARAEDMLSETEIPVTEVAYQSGFSSIKTFNRLFRSITGLSPSQYRAGER